MVLGVPLLKHFRVYLGDLFWVAQGKKSITVPSRHKACPSCPLQFDKKVLDVILVELNCLREGYVKYSVNLVSAERNSYNLFCLKNVAKLSYYMIKNLNITY